MSSPFAATALPIHAIPATRTAEGCDYGCMEHRFTVLASIAYRHYRCCGLDYREERRRPFYFRLKRFAAGFLGMVALGALMAGPASAQVFTIKATFLADPRVGAITTEGFEGFAVGTNLTGATVGNATFNQLTGGSLPLTVIAGATGVRFPMSPSSGANVLSPGGSNPTLENDDLEIVFTTPVQAAGIDVIFDVPDGASFTSVTILDASQNVLGTANPIPAPNPGPGFQFIGFISNSANIKFIRFDEFDPTALDDNIAYDTLVYSSVASSAAPEPASLLLLTVVAGPLALLGRRQRRRK